MKALWGIDLGGTKIEGVILDPSNNYKTITRLRIPTEAKQGYQHIIQRISHLLDLMMQESGLKPDAVGIGTPGSINPQTQTLRNSNTTCLNGQPFHQDLENALKIPVKMSNDANCFAVAETKLGVVADTLPQAQVVFGVIMGTGVGGGLVVNGRAISGRQGIGGEWGHNFLDESGGPCYCGKTGCVETIISGPALERYYRENGGEPMRLPQILKNHLAGNDPLATQTIERLIYFFGKAISVVINIVDPEAIILGGGLGNIDLLYTEGLAATYPHVFNPNPNLLFLKPKLGDSAGVIGAALL